MTAETTVVREQLTREEARTRAAAIDDVRARVHLDLPVDGPTFRSRTELTFTVHHDTSTFVDLTAHRVQRVELDGTVLDAARQRPTRIELPSLPAGVHTLSVDADMRYQHEGRGLHRFVDPADGRTYLHSQFQTFDAHLVYACFDQPDLRTVFDLSVTAPTEWVVVSNGALAAHDPGQDTTLWRFTPTPPLSPYITAVVAGAYTAVRDVHTRADGSQVPLGLYVRRSLAEHLDAAELFEITRQGLDFFEGVFQQRYPFGKYDQLLVPEFSAGAMENAGCVTFSETYVFRSRVTDALRARRAETVLHEMAHMWFGDLVTMRWWDDLWLNESFATFMAVLAQASATRWTDAFVTFLDADKAWAKSQDQMPSTHPIAADMPDVVAVHQNFDGITYAKGASVLRQLVAWVGQEEFLAGCRAYFDRHAWGNTELTDFLAALELTSGRDLGAWRDEWLLTTGVPTLTAAIDVDGGRYTRVEIEQSVPRPAGDEPGDRGVARRHRLAIGVYDLTSDGLVRRQREELDLEGDRAEVVALNGVVAGDVLLVNDDDLTYAKVVMDPGSLATVRQHLSEVRDPLARTLIWASMWDMVRDAVLPGRDFVTLIERHAHAEHGVAVLQRLLARATTTAERYVAVEHRDEELSRLACQAQEQAERAEPASDHQLAWVRHWANVARSPADAEPVRQLLAGDLALPGLTLDRDLRWHLIVRLAAAGVLGEDTIAAELEHDDTDLGRRHAATARAARPDPGSKAAAWDRLLDDRALSHTMSRQLWAGFSQVWQQDVLAPYTDAWFEVIDAVWRERSLDWAIEFSHGTFPQHAADEALLLRVDEKLAEQGVPDPLRRVLLEQRDTLLRTLAARELDARAS